MTVLKEQDTTITLKKQCHMCSKEFTIEVPTNGYFAWCSGERIQKAMSDVPPEERELLISGICGKCFDKMFK